jgi:hypothetical protein
MVIAEENEAETAVVGSRAAPYITSLAHHYGYASNMQAGYPVACPSLAAYLLITSGDRHGICDDDPPADHQLSGNNIFRQVATSGRQWRQYSESMSTRCQRVDGAPGGYLVRHAPPPYYPSEATRCRSWDVPMGTVTSGALHTGLTQGLAAYSFVTANACDEMHGASPCPSDLVGRGDRWLRMWMPRIIASDDFRSGRLVVIVTWDEGSATSNHIPTLVLAEGMQHVTVTARLDHCSTLRGTEELLDLPLIGCARTARSLKTAFGLR